MLNDDVAGVISSFMTTSTRLNILRHKYTNDFLRDGLSKKTMKQLKVIIDNVNNTDCINPLQLYMKPISKRCGKKQQIENIITFFERAHCISNGGPYYFHSGSLRTSSWFKQMKNEKRRVLMKKNKREIYSGIVLQFMNLLVSIVNKEK